MKYAVIFKCHQWNDLIEEMFAQMKEFVLNGDIYIQIDNTNGDFNVNFDKIHVINEKMIEEIGLPKHGGFWYNGDYSTILFFLDNSNYDYYVTIEYDVFVSNSIDDIVNSMKENYIDVIGQQLPPAVGPHLKDCIPYYGVNIVEKSLFCISFFSKLAVSCFYSRRLSQSKVREKYALKEWPIGEAVMRTECKISDLNYADLEEFCDNLDHYDWNKGSLIDYAREASKEKTFVHPVSNAEKFVKTNFPSVREDYDRLYEKIKKSKNQMLFSVFYNNVDDSFDKKIILEDYRNIFKENSLPHINENIISIGKTCSQSSTCSYSYSQDESSRALNIFPRYGHSIHTDSQENPWWMLDIGESKFVRNIYFFDRPELDGSRTRNLKISVGEIKENMKTVFYNDSDVKLWNIKIEVLEKIRFVKIHIEGYGLLNFDTVIVTT
ncbi:hypothetical protein [Gluconobacter sp. OJB]|uniref:hypothetical protein n=1 Tax=Gluconobacter sp. OJB TaxID=3145196 RepID=UPI0031F73BD6